MLKDEFDVEEFCDDSPKLKGILQSIVRKNLVNEGRVTLEGEELLQFLSSSKGVKLTKKKPNNDDFSKWWSTYPPVDTFSYRGKSFKGSRALRSRKEDCRVKFNKVLSTGEYTLDELIEALKLEIEQKAENSYKSGDNKMKYMQNSLTYLNQATYDSYIQLVRQGFKSKKEEEKATTNETFI